jgi:PAT family beta-lactamase induction signal transducer AmpG
MSRVAEPVARPNQGGRLVAAITDRRLLTMLALGFSSGLPSVLIIATLSLWLRDVGVSLETIGFISLVTAVYAIKFLWAPVVDRVRLPWLTTRFGPRRTWMLATQGPIAIGLLLMSATDPSTSLGIMVALALFVGVASATQDIAIDAWRIEVAAAGQQGIMAAAYQWGYRLAILAGAIPLLLAEPFGWNVAYATMSTFMVVGLTAAAAAPVEEIEAGGHRVASGSSHFAAAIVDPLRDFFRHHGSGASMALALVCVYRLPDLVRSVMGPFFLDLGFTFVELAEVQRVWGMAMTLAGVAAGGVAVNRLGLKRALLIGAFCGPAAGIALAWLTTQGRHIGALIAVTALENAAAGFAATCLIAYMSSLTTPGFTATQYALLSSLFALPGRLLASQSGWIVEASAEAARAGGVLAPLAVLFTGLPAGSYGVRADAAALGAGYLVFFLYSSLLGIAGIVLTVCIARR